MSKGELVAAVATKTELTKREVEALLAARVEAIMETVAAGEKVTLVRFGSFEPRERAAREGRNPQTGKAIKIAETTVLAIAPGKQFKERLGG